MQPEHKTILWIKTGSGCCEAAKNALADTRLEVRPFEAAWQGEDPLAAEVLAQLAWQDWQLPVVLLDGEFVEPGEVTTRSCDGGAVSCSIIP